MSGIGLIGLVFLAASPLADDLKFSSSFHGDELPEKAVPKWVAKGNAAEVKLADGELKVISQGPNKRQFYIIDQKSGAWDMTSGVATVEFRLKCATDNPEDEVFRVQLGDGKQVWRAVFFNQRCNGARVATDDWDTYRLVVKDGKLQISSEKAGVIASDIEGSPSEDTPFLLFGTFKNSPSEAQRSWDLDFIRWTNEEAMRATEKS